MKTMEMSKYERSFVEEEGRDEQGEGGEGGERGDSDLRAERGGEEGGA